MVKRVLLAALAVALLVPVGLAGVWIWNQAADPVAAQAAEAEHSPVQTITVVGNGTTRVEPDIARLSVGVETTAATVSEAVEQNEAKMVSIIAALEQAGIAGEDIQTTNYSVHQERYPEGMPRVPGTESEGAPTYRVSNNVNVVIRDLDSTGAVLDAVVEAGANSIWGVSFGLDDPKATEDEARVDAMADAEYRATALAELGGVTLGPVMSISEVIGSAVPMPMALSERAATGGGSLSPGELEVGYQVQVTYFVEH